MKSHTTWILLLMISILLSACSGSDPLLVAEFPDTSQMALAKPLVPGLNAPDPASSVVSEEVGSDEDQQGLNDEGTESATVEPVDEPPVSLLPAKQAVTLPEPANNSTDSDISSPAQRVPSTLEANPCNDVDKAMIKSFEDEIADLEVFLESLEDILERGEVRKEIKEKRRDLRKYKKDHSCK